MLGLVWSTNVKPVDNNVSPYLQQPLRTLEQVQQEREDRQRQLADADARAKKNEAPGAASETAPAAKPAAAPVPSTRVDESV